MLGEFAEWVNSIARKLRDHEDIYLDGVVGEIVDFDIDKGKDGTWLADTNPRGAITVVLKIKFQRNALRAWNARHAKGIAKDPEPEVLALESNEPMKMLEDRENIIDVEAEEVDDVEVMNPDGSTRWIEVKR